MEDGDQVYAVNLLSRTALQLSVDSYRTYLGWATGRLSAEELSEDGEFLAVLRAGLFLVDSDFDEMGFIQQQTIEQRFQTRQLGLVIAPTLGCNFSCHYCFEAHRDKAFDPASEQRLVDFVLRRLPECDELAVQWFGGEPLRAFSVMRSLSQAFQQACSDLGKAYAATVITNGYLMTPEVSSRFPELGIQEVQITLDGDRPLHDRTRHETGGGGSFDRILMNLRAVPEEIAVNVRVHLAPFNQQSVASLIERLGRSGMAEHIDLMYFAPLFNYHVEMTSPAYAPDGKRFATAEQFAKLEIETLRLAQQWGFRLKDFLDVSYGICTAVRANTYVVDPTGGVSKCYKDVGVAAEQVGRIDGMLDETKLREWLNVDVPRDAECRECAFLPVCLGGCSKQWTEGADKSVICTPLRYNYRERIRLYFAED